MMKLQAHLQVLPEGLNHQSGLIDPQDHQEQDQGLHPGDLQAQDDLQLQGEHHLQAEVQMVKHLLMQSSKLNYVS